MLSTSQVQQGEINAPLWSLLPDASMTPCYLQLLEASQIDVPLINTAEELCVVRLP